MIAFDAGSDGVATILLEASGPPASLFGGPALDALERAVERALADARVRGVILASETGDFILRDDPAETLALSGPRAAFDAAMRFHALTRRMETGGKPFAAALSGSALGAGFELALACGRRFAADAPGARFGLPNARFGLPPGGGGTQRLARMLGLRKAIETLLAGARLRAADALRAELVDDVAAPGAEQGAARAWLRGAPDPRRPWDVRGFAIPGGGPWSAGAGPALIAANARTHARVRGNDPAARAILSCVYEGALVDISTGLKIEARRFAEAATGRAARNRVRALCVFASDARRFARRPAAPRAAFARVGVLGAGLMGAGIAGAAARAGIDAVMVDLDAARAERGKARIAAAMERMRLPAETRERALARIAATGDYSALAGCALVVEAVFEDRAAKAEATAKAEAALAPDAVFAANTSTLPISGLAEASARPANFIGLHFFSPVERMRLVEIIRGRATSDAALARAMDFVRALGKTPIVVNDSRGFYTSRVFGTFVREGFAMLAEGVPPALIENAARSAGMPVGPLAVADEVSLDLMRAVSAQTCADLGAAWAPPPGEDVLETMAARLRRPGRKAGRGFYDYPEGGAKRLWPGLAEHFPPAAESPAAADVGRRLLCIQALEAARCLEEGVLESAEDGDVGSVLGWGFPAFTGGALALIDNTGAAAFAAAADRLVQSIGPRFAPPALLRDMAARGARFHPPPGEPKA